MSSVLDELVDLRLEGEGEVVLAVSSDLVETPFSWDASIRAPARRRQPSSSPWICEENGGKFPNSRGNLGTIHGNIVCHNPSHNEQQLSRAEKGGSRFFSKKSYLGVHSKSVALSIIPMQKGSNLNSGSGTITPLLDIVMGQDGDDSPLLYQEGLKRPSNDPTRLVVSDSSDPSGFNSSISAGPAQQAS
ncbi:hypothetical protein V6N13_059254 [Hibiscus sabdariffa]